MLNVSFFDSEGHLLGSVAFYPDNEESEVAVAKGYFIRVNDWDGSKIHTHTAPPTPLESK